MILLNLKKFMNILISDQLERNIAHKPENLVRNTEKYNDEVYAT